MCDFQAQYMCRHCAIISLSCQVTLNDTWFDAAVEKAQSFVLFLFSLTRLMSAGVDIETGVEVRV